MNRLYASPKGYAAYPRGDSTFSLSPNKYVHCSDAFIFTCAAYDSRSSKSKKLTYLLDFNLAHSLPSAVDANSSNGSFSSAAFLSCWSSSFFHHGVLRSSLPSRSASSTVQRTYNYRPSDTMIYRKWKDQKRAGSAGNVFSC